MAPRGASGGGGGGASSGKGGGVRTKSTGTGRRAIEPTGGNGTGQRKPAVAVTTKGGAKVVGQTGRTVAGTGKKIKSS